MMGPSHHLDVRPGLGESGDTRLVVGRSLVFDSDRQSDSAKVDGGHRDAGIIERREQVLHAGRLQYERSAH